MGFLKKTLVLGLIFPMLFLPQSEQEQFKRIVEHRSDSYNTFTGWDWFIDEETHLAMGQAKGGYLSRFGPKIHPVNPTNPKPWSAGEYFCDPDTVLFVRTSEEAYITYAPYLNWAVDSYINNENSFARMSYKYLSGTGYFQEIPEDVRELNDIPRLDIRVDHTMEAGKPWIKTVINVTNRYSETIDFLYTYQDAAYMWLPNANQDNVKSFIFDSETGYSSSPVVSHGTKWSFSGSYDPEKQVLGAIFTNNPWARIGVLSDYLFFEEKSDGIYKYVNKAEDVKTVDDVYALLGELIEKKNDRNLINRAIVLPVMGLKPGESATFHYYRLGISNRGMSSEEEVKDLLLEFNEMNEIQ